MSDYSRYLPADVGVRATFVATYLGCTLGSILPFVFGAVVALAMTPGDDVMAGVDETTGAWARLLLVLFLVSVISHNALNLYGTVLVADHLRADVRGAMDSHRAHPRRSLRRGDDRVGVLRDRCLG